MRNKPLFGILTFALIASLTASASQQESELRPVLPIAKPTRVVGRAGISIDESNNRTRVSLLNVNAWERPHDRIAFSLFHDSPGLKPLPIGRVAVILVSVAEKPRFRKDSNLEVSVDGDMYGPLPVKLEPIDASSKDVSEIVRFSLDIALLDRLVHAQQAWLRIGEARIEINSACKQELGDMSRALRSE